LFVVDSQYFNGLMLIVVCQLAGIYQKDTIMLTILLLLLALPIARIKLDLKRHLINNFKLS